jgi:hypothetical protein
LLSFRMNHSVGQHRGACLRCGLDPSIRRTMQETNSDKCAAGMVRAPNPARTVRPGLKLQVRVWALRKLPLTSTPKEAVGAVSISSASLGHRCRIRHRVPTVRWVIKQKPRCAGHSTSRFSESSLRSGQLVVRCDSTHACLGSQPVHVSLLASVSRLTPPPG